MYVIVNTLRKGDKEEDEDDDDDDDDEINNNNAENIWATYRESTKSGNYSKQPYWALQSYFEKY
jgi:hypothetical protein